jgi:hypothetical protein
MACEAANAAERAAETCKANPEACALVAASIVVVIVIPELGPILVPVWTRK